MSFHERFKGRTSLIDKEGITGVVKSQAKPILKPEDSPIEYKKNTSSLEIIPEKSKIQEILMINKNYQIFQRIKHKREMFKRKCSNFKMELLKKEGITICQDLI